VARSRDRPLLQLFLLDALCEPNDAVSPCTTVMLAGDD
jgi:hypothetical protein